MEKIPTPRLKVLIALLATIFILGCSSEGEITYTVSSTGDSITSASMEKAGGNYKVTLAPIIDPDTDEVLGEEDLEKIGATVAFESTSATASCTTTIEFGAGSTSSADIAFLVDTTGSMGSAVSGIIDSIDTFTQTLVDAGLDVKFAMATIGDAFNTKSVASSDYTTGTGTYEPPSFDTIERPLIDFTTLESFKAFATEVKNNVGSGAGGVGGTENYYAAVMAMAGESSDHTGLSTRDGVPYYQVLVGDNCAYTEEAQGDSIEGVWLPPSKDDLTDLQGKVTVHVVREPANDTCSGDLLSLADIADATGGAKLDLGTGDVDLSAINLEDYITNFWIITINSSCTSGTSFNLILTLTVDFDGDDTADLTQTFTFVITVV